MLISRSSLIVFWIALWILVWNCPVPAFAAQKVSASSAPPQPISQAVEVKRGQSVEIPLKIFGRRNETLNYIIRTKPRSGKLTSTKRVDSQSVVVLYEPPADLAITADSFSFSVKSSDGISAPVDVTIKIVDEPPMLIVPDTIEFPALLAGKSDTKEITIANKGGGISEGTVQVDPPYQISGDASYHLAVNEEKVFQITFAPTTGGPLEREVRYSSRPDVTTLLRGRGLAPLEVSPSELVLKHDAGSSFRSGVVTVTNHTEGKLDVTVAPNARLKVEQEFSLQSNESAPVIFQLAPEDMGPVDESIEFKSGAISSVLKVRGRPVEAILAIRPNPPAFGTIGVGKLAQLRVEVENSGGVKAPLHVTIGEPFSLAGPVPAFIDPGEVIPLTLQVKSDKPGEIKSTLQVQAGTRSMALPVVAVASIAAVPATPSNPEAESAPRESASHAKTPAPESGTLLPPGQPRIVALTSESCKIQWPLSLSKAPKFQATVRDLSLESHQLKVDWHQYTEFTSWLEGDQVAGQFSGLLPGTFYYLRVHPAGFDESRQLPILEFSFTTPPKKKFIAFRRGPLLGIGLVVAAGLLIWQMSRRGRGSL